MKEQVTTDPLVLNLTALSEVDRLPAGVRRALHEAATEIVRLRESLTEAWGAAFEEAAKLCEQTYPEFTDGCAEQLPCFDTAKDCAEAIRAQIIRRESK